MRTIRTAIRTAVVVACCSGGVVGGCKTKHVVTQSFTLTELRAEGNEAYGAGDFQGAADAYGRYLEIRPHEASIRYQMGLTQLQLDDPAEAAWHLKTASDLKPGNDAYRAALVDAMSRAGRRDEVMDLLTQYAIGEQTASAYMRLGGYASDAGLMDEAERAYLEAARLAGRKSVTPHRSLARFYDQIGNRAQATERWRMVLWFDRDDTEARARLRERGQVFGPSLPVPPPAG